jgi:anaerobic dimethyl sulfoxide reductase subunit A
LIILWGWNPASTTSGTNTAWFLAQAKEKGTRIIAVDPFLTDTAATFADQWVPIRPGTDAAMLIAMAHVMIKEGLYDRKFLDTYTIGFEPFMDYVTGVEDGVPKTPSWAEAITGVSAEVIEKLAREYATTKPAALMAGIGPGRTAYGEQYHRAASTLAVMAGNVGIHGGDAAGRAWESLVGGYPYGEGIGSALKFLRNPIEERKPGTLPVPFGEVHPRIHYVKVADALLRGKEGGYPADYKMVFMVNTNFVNSLPDTNKVTRALQKPEFIVVAEQYMNATARYADILLPTASYVEREDIALGVGMAYVGFQNKVIEPLGECKPHNEIVKALAERMGITDYDEKDGEERIRDIAQRLQIPDYEAFKEKGVYWIRKEDPYVAFKKQIEDPENNPFRTPSGKIEIFSRRLADVGDPLLPPIPKYIESWESINDPLAEKYPLQLMTNHSKRRANAQFDSFPWLKESLPQAIMMNSADAQVREIEDGEMVRVFNDRGETIVPANVTQRVMPGVAILPEGAWYDPDEKGVDRGGCANVLTKDEISPTGSFTYNTVLVQIEKV